MSNPYYPDDCPSPEHDPVPAALRSGDLFGVWWYNIGSGLTPLATEDQEAHARRVSEAAWNAAVADRCNALSAALVRLDLIYRSEMDEAPVRPEWLSSLLPNT